MKSLSHERPSKEEALLTIAFAMAQRGTCSRRRVGAIIASHRGSTLASGYNGALSGFPHCAPHYDYQPCDISEHAERNAIYDAASRGIALNGSAMYCTDSPCYGCARGIIQVGIQRVVYVRNYHDDSGANLLHNAGIFVQWYHDFEPFVIMEGT